MIPSLIGLNISCGSLLNEFERIRAASEKATPAAALVAASVLYTSPADGAVAVPVQAYIDIVFDQTIDAATATGAGDQGSCNGAILASYDDFATCGGSPVVSGNIVRVNAGNTLPQGAIIKVKVTPALFGTNGLPVNAYQSPRGFSLAAPCGQNCFYSDSAPLTASTNQGAHSFVVPSGSKAGWIVAINGNTTASTYYDPATNQTSVGPTICAGIASGAHSILISTTGGFRSGKIITFAGGATSNACTYDPVAETYSAGPGLAGAQPNTGALTIPILLGGSAGNYLLIDNTTTSSYLYSVLGDLFATSTVAPTTGGAGSSWFRIDDPGANLGKAFIFNGGPSTNTMLLTDTGIGIAAGPALASAAADGAFSFRVNAGTNADRFLMANAGGSTMSVLYNQSANSYAAGPTMLCPISSGARSDTLATGPRAGQTLMLCGGNTQEYMFYNHSTNNLTLLNTLTGTVGIDSSMTKITTGVNAGKYFLVNGNFTGNTSLFDPAQDSFVGSRLFRSPSAGFSGFSIRSGPNTGRAMIMTGGTGGALSTSLYNPEKGLMEMGPNTFTALGAGATNFPVTNGTHAGKQFIFQGGGSSAIQKYDPVNNSFSTAVVGVDFTTSPSVKNDGSRIFLIPNTGAQANNYFSINGGGSPNGDFFNTTSNTFTSAVPITGCAAVTAGSWVFKVLGGIHNDKFMIICGGLPTSLFTPATASFAGGPALTSATAAGAHGFYISSGNNSGKYLMIRGTGTGTQVFDPSGPSWSAGPTLCGNPGSGGFNIPINAGVNAGKTLVALGGGLTTTCIFDPAQNLFVTGPTTGSHAGYAIGAGGSAFATGGGIYPTAYVVIHGGASTVFGHFFAY